MTSLHPIILIGSAAIASATLTAVVRRASKRLDFVDRPGGHKGHVTPVALGGGLAVTGTVVAAMLVGVGVAWGLSESLADSLGVPPAFMKHLPGIRAKAPLAIAIAGAACTLCVVGLIDDKRPLPVWLRLGIQLVVAAFLVIGFDLRLLTLLPAWASIALTMLWILCLTNSMNFLDNMDGLSAGVAAIAGAIFAIAASMAGQLFVPSCCWILVGALVGFLPFNFHPATIYLGDAGSTVVGMLLAVFTILTTFASPAQGDQPIGVIAPLIVMAVPLYDTASVFLLRMRAGVPIWTGDRRHFSHRLVKRGMSVPKAVLVIWLATLVTAMPALLLPRADWLSAFVIFSQAILVVILVALLESSGNHEST
ncbi:MAG: undecaprenyl/decaprenyl-phosphate alpha-N-acetylglucosaminyl 1-phosphate transferase [Phycisphaerales bacterium]|nr:undecaprenyl/decaprenyl-phosphate alpha-N-acetylglucosaminyl 1-phosphate transferase [Phycisphaerales bacterium]MCB9863906.1 undecaprenyl/decaprenyl-phosphate alpha-N-acetylglucosaminyl 1-phosphate transferase [Phycisphaerales bacterium]